MPAVCFDPFPEARVLIRLPLAPTKTQQLRSGQKDASSPRCSGVQVRQTTSRRYNAAQTVKSLITLPTTRNHRATQRQSLPHPGTSHQLLLPSKKIPRYTHPTFSGHLGSVVLLALRASTTHALPSQRTKLHPHTLLLVCLVKAIVEAVALSAEIQTSAEAARRASI